MRLSPVLPAVLAVAAAGAALAPALGVCAARPEPEAAEPPAPQPQPSPARIRWRRSVALGLPWAGRLIRGVQLPARGPSFETWDPVLRRSPNRGWRRWGTGRLVRVLLRVARRYRARHPGAQPLLVGDLSRRRGGHFGREFGTPGHVSHQNGLDADIYYPRANGVPRAPKNAGEINRRLSQELVNRFVAAGATQVFVGPGTRLSGPPGIVRVIARHDNHLHIRIAR